MAAANYDEVTHSSSITDWSGIDPLYKWDTHFPQRLSRLQMQDTFPTPGGGRRNKRGRTRNAARFKTQPITFDEIKEVDEEGAVAQEEAKSADLEGLKSQFTAFSRSMDGLLTGIPTVNVTETSASRFEVERSVRNHPLYQKEIGATAMGTSGSSPKDSQSTTNSSVTSLPAGLPQSDPSRARRQRRRHKKSIEEEPELETTTSQGAG